MRGYKRPCRLNSGDRISTVSLSWGGPHDYPNRYLAGKHTLQNIFGLEVIESSHALSDPEWLEQNPHARAMDFIDCLLDPEIKGIFSTIGGDDAYKLIPYVDLQIIRDNPKIFIGYSDSTVIHFLFHKAGVVSFYGPSVMSGFAENGGIHKYLRDSVLKNLFSNDIVGLVRANTEGWVTKQFDWSNVELQNMHRPLLQPVPWKYIQGDKIARGKLLGGCTETLEMIKNTSIWPQLDDWRGIILFLENSEGGMSVAEFEKTIISYGELGIIQRINGLLFGKPGGGIPEEKFIEYDQAIIKLCRKFGRADLPVITQMDFGHTDPMLTLPVSIEAQIDPVANSFSILESGCI